MEAFAATLDGHGDIMILRLSAELDAFGVGTLRNALASISPGARVVFDVTAVTFMDSAGLGGLVGGIRRIREGGGDVAVCCAAGAVRRMLHTVGLERIVGVVGSLADASAVLAPEEAADGDR